MRASLASGGGGGQGLDGAGGFSAGSVKRVLGKVLADVLPGGSGELV